MHYEHTVQDKVTIMIAGESISLLFPTIIQLFLVNNIVHLRLRTTIHTGTIIILPIPNIQTFKMQGFTPSELSSKMTEIQMNFSPN